jgi:aminoglycoside phosphotransferase (APT) family kinase protein
MPSEARESEAVAASPWYPDLPELEAGLAKIWCGTATSMQALQVRSRKPNSYTSTFPSEIVTCRLADGRERRVFVKYGRTGERDPQEHKWRGGVKYEAEVYRQVLHGLPLPLPAFHGFLASERLGGPALVLEYLEQTLRVSFAPDEGAMVAAAVWLGRFHALQEERLRSNVPAFLARCDADFCASWLRRLLTCARPHLPRFPWLPTVCRRYRERIGLLTEQPATVIHGEFSPRNVLWHRGRVVPTDWETAAMGPGEIDLATLVNGWDEGTLRACQDCYQQSRWPHGSPTSFSERFSLAELYVAFRWLVVCPEWAASPGPPPDLESLRDRAGRAGLI